MPSDYTEFIGEGYRVGVRHLRKEVLRVGAYYYGRCRNASIARWDGERFWYWRRKFGVEFTESIHCPEDDDGFDLFFAQDEVWIKPIPLKETTHAASTPA